MSRHEPARQDHSRPARPPESGRDAACRTLARQARAFPLLLATDPDTHGLDPREAALAHAIHGAVIRRWLTLSHLIEAASGRTMGDLEPPLRAVLLAGAAQVLLLDRIPPHAAIDQSVEWAKRRIRPKAGGLANAVLRKLSGLVARDPSGLVERRQAWSDRVDEVPMPDGSARVLTGPILPDDAWARLSVATSVPGWVLDRWASRTNPGDPRSNGRERARRLALHALIDPPTILNTAHAAGPIPDTTVPHGVPGHHVWLGTHAELGLLLRARPDLWVQDPASSASVALARASWTSKPPRVIADVCAGQGTKTRQLAAAFPEAEILATDTDADRLATLRALFDDHPRVRVMDRDQLGREGLGACGLILLDVPCSNSGVLARRPEARYRLGARTLDRMGEVQRQIGADAIPLLAPGGRILYATCSLEPEENDQMAAWFARWHAARTIASRAIEPAGAPGGPAAACHDGSFAALMGR